MNELVTAPHPVFNKRWFRRTIILLWHAMGITLAYWGAFLLRFDFEVPAKHLATFTATLPLVLVVFLVVFALFRLNAGIWAYYSLDDVLRTGQALFCGVGIMYVVMALRYGVSLKGYPRSAFLSLFLLLGVWETGGRFAVRWIKRRKSGLEDPGISAPKKALIIGSPAQADIMLRSLGGTNSMGRVAAIVCDDPSSRNLLVHGVRIAGTIREAGKLARRYKAGEILILPPYTNPQYMRDILDHCSQEKVQAQFRVVPSLEDLASGKLDVSLIREVEIEDLLEREPASFDRNTIAEFLRGQSVMVTGAGGSIGSEICRQVARHQPRMLVLFERSEFALYTIEMELQGKFPDLAMLAYAGDAGEEADVRDALAQAGGVDVLYHAAAYKHVNLMEKNIANCIRNNVLSSNVAARVAGESGVKRFVLISSDKAVNPKSIMGASKRLAERVVLERPSGSTNYVAVRFGNVLGSSGSVIPLFKRQIAAHGPVTVTSPDARRFFMTIPEAVELVLMAGIVGDDRQIMVLEMGKPVKIIDLARRLIELSGFIPEQDIKIEITGLKPGEKEFEELMTEDENVVQTSYDKIWTFSKNGLGPAEAVDLAELQSLIGQKDNAGMRQAIARYVPENMLEADAESTPG